MGEHFCLGSNSPCGRLPRCAHSGGGGGGAVVMAQLAVASGFCSLVFRLNAVDLPGADGSGVGREKDHMPLPPLI